jgi:hypothetical protein
MKTTKQILIAITAVCLFTSGALWGNKVVARASSGEPQGSATVQQVRIQDGTQNYLADVTPLKMLKVDGSGALQPVSITGAVTIVNSTKSGITGTLVVPSGGAAKTPDLGFPKVLVVCANDSGLASNFIIALSVDGNTWFPIGVVPSIGGSAGGAPGAACVSVPPTRFLRLSGPAGTAFYQAAY